MSDHAAQLQTLIPHAISRIGELIDCSDPKVALAASREALELAGVGAKHDRETQLLQSLPAALLAPALSGLASLFGGRSIDAAQLESRIEMINVTPAPLSSAAAIVVEPAPAPAADSLTDMVVAESSALMDALRPPNVITQRLTRRRNGGLNV